MQHPFHLGNLTVFHDQEFLLIEGGGQELVPDRRDRRLSGPKAQELVQVESEAKDDRQDDEEEDQKDFHFIEPKLREVLPQDQREDADERQDREDDPEDAHAQVPAVQPLRGSDLLTLGAHSSPHVADITREGIFPAVAKQIRQVSSRAGAARMSKVAYGENIGDATRTPTSACTACSRAESSPCGLGPPARSSRPRA